jgi:5-methylcytosine-specific restriction endonuclease McrA
MPGKPKRRRGRQRHGAVTADSHATSAPTSRAAYADTRKWLLKRHGPVCAYCGVKCAPRTMTLDHVAPRRGLSAYDRRDNLVLACTRCNTIKADKPFLAFLFAQRARATNLLRYGDHLSAGILDLCRPLAGDARPAPAVEPRIVYGDEDDDDGESPYADSPYAPGPTARSAKPPASSRKPPRRRRRRAR